MGKWMETIQKTFAAVSFAEAGEHDTAMEMAGIKPNWSKVSLLSKAWDNIFAAVTFAEAGCADRALEFVGAKTARRDVRSLEIFLKDVGLQGVRVRYGLAMV
ncbi:MAG: hypothetical protein ABIK98_16440 [Pseudomonadota bacterium]